MTRWLLRSGTGRKRFGSRPVDVFYAVIIERVASDESMVRTWAERIGFFSAVGIQAAEIMEIIDQRLPELHH